MTMSILKNIREGMKSQSEVVEKVPMTEAYRIKLAKKLKTEGRANTYPNKFDIALPYRVAVNKSGEYTNYGFFTDADVASAVGTIAAKFHYGEKAVAGNFDIEKVEAHQEFIDWMADDRNQEVIALVS